MKKVERKRLPEWLSEEFGKYCPEKAIIKVNKIIFKNPKTGKWPKALNKLRTVHLRKFTKS